VLEDTGDILTGHRHLGSLPWLIPLARLPSFELHSIVSAGICKRDFTVANGKVCVARFGGISNYFYSGKATFFENVDQFPIWPRSLKPQDSSIEEGMWHSETRDDCIPCGYSLWHLTVLYLGYLLCGSWKETENHFLFFRHRYGWVSIINSINDIYEYLHLYKEDFISLVLKDGSQSSSPDVSLPQFHFLVLNQGKKKTEEVCGHNAGLPFIKTD
jgi:hypothetical protein